VGELAHVAAPARCLDALLGARGEAGHAALEVARDALEEGARQRQDVDLAIAQRGQLDREHGEPVVEVLAEPALVDHRAQVAVGRRDPADVDLEGAAAADALESALLEDAQELGLELGLELADLVEEERAAVGELEPAALALAGAGERALLVAEQLA